jgi:uncharacterized membrane protein YeaQ/YmgE (transglycosylase-associated protein family)
MPKPRKKIKHLEVSYDPENRDQDSPPEDFVGKFLVGAFTALVTALISQAVSNQINWFVVVLAAVVALVVIAVYQKRKG